MNIQIFPNELLVNILERVSLQKRLQLRLLSHRWLYLIESECKQITALKVFSYGNVKQSNLSFKRYNLPQKDPNNRALWSRDLEKDLLTNGDRFNRKTADFFGLLFPNLENLVLDFTKFSAKSWKRVHYLLKKCSNLRTLSLCGPYYVRWDWFDIESFVCNGQQPEDDQEIFEGDNPFYYSLIPDYFNSNEAKCLKHLRLANIGYLDNQGLLKLIAQLTELEVLWLSFACDYVLTGKSLHTLTSLNKLEKFHIESGIDSIWHFEDPRCMEMPTEFAGKRNISSLKRLYWYSHQTFDFCEVYFMRWLKAWFPNLQELYIKDMYREDRRWLRRGIKYNAWPEITIKLLFEHEGQVLDQEIDEESSDEDDF